MDCPHGALSYSSLLPVGNVSSTSISSTPKHIRIYSTFKNYAHGLRSLQSRHNDHDGVSNHRRPDCLLNRLFMWRSKKTSKLRVTGLCEGNPPDIVGFPSQRASNAENVSIWWRYYVWYALVWFGTVFPHILQCYFIRLTQSQLNDAKIWETIPR